MLRVRRSPQLILLLRIASLSSIVNSYIYGFIFRNSSNQIISKRRNMSILKDSASQSEEFPFPQPPLSARIKRVYEGKSVFITGASSGLGAALALHLSTCNTSHLFLSGRNEIALQNVAQQCENLATTEAYFNKPKTQTKVHVIPCDLADLKSVQQMAEIALSIHDVDILIHCGGISSRSKFVDTSIDVDELLIKVNYLSGAVLAKNFVPGMIQKQEGKIIWISSVQGKVGIPNRTSYAASKFAVQGYCDSLRSELSSSGVSVHVVSPGYIRTSLSKNAMMGTLGQTYQKMDEATAQGADPSQVAFTVLNSIAKGKTDLIVAATASARIAIWLRFVFPSLLERILLKRFVKSQHPQMRKERKSD
mmetsp:Transcript_28139/g.40289  ORF Transcript_28139/g.40289 Transcript_28139/m.40289 type:complete len:364 (-) Transcript_28139:374-1465(-)